MDTYVERPGKTKERLHVNRAYLIMVAIDGEGRPTPVPKLLCETEAEEAAFEAGKQRRALRLRSKTFY